jgi:hypothetical protein
MPGAGPATGGANGGPLGQAGFGQGPAPGAPGQGMGPIDRGNPGRIEAGLSSRIGGLNSGMGPASIGPPNVGDFRPQGAINRANGPGPRGPGFGPGFGPRPPVDNIPRFIQQLPGMLPPPPPPGGLLPPN